MTAVYEKEFAAGQNAFVRGDSIKDVAEFWEHEEDEEKSMSYALGFIDALVSLIRRGGGG